MAATLYEYYTSQGKPLPTLQERAPLYEQAGLGKATEYQGTAQQNTALLGYLQQPKPAAPAIVPAPAQGESPEAYTQRLDGNAPTNTGTAPAIPMPAPIVQTSTADRIKEIKSAFGIGTAPAQPDLFTPQSQAELEKARAERNAINTEAESILAERLKLEDEFRQFQQTAGIGVSEGGRIGAVTEEGRKYQARFDELNRRELVLETKLSNRNSIISELMGLQKTDYENAVTDYNNRFSQAMQLYNVLDKEDDEIQTNAKASLDVFGGAIKAQIEAGTMTYSQISGAQQAKLNELELQAGLPQGSTLAVLQTLKPNEEILYKNVDDYGNFNVITKNADGTLSYKTIAGVEKVRPPASSIVSSSTGLKVNPLTAVEQQKLYPTLPASVIGEDENVIIADLQKTTPPKWYGDMLAKNGQVWDALNPTRKQAKWMEFKEIALAHIQAQLQKETGSQDAITQLLQQLGQTNGSPNP